MREGSNAPLWLLGDHLGSTSKTVDYTGTTVTSTALYAPWGTTRFTSGTLLTKYTYTGQYSYNTGATNDFGLIYYGARFYDPSLGRWNQPDSIIPEASQGTQAWDRMGFVNNNPVRYFDLNGRSAYEYGYWPGQPNQPSPPIPTATPTPSSSATSTPLP